MWPPVIVIRSPIADGSGASGTRVSRGDQLRPHRDRTRHVLAVTLRRRASGGNRRCPASGGRVEFLQTRAILPAPTTSGATRRTGKRRRQTPRRGAVVLVGAQHRRVRVPRRCSDQFRDRLRTYSVGQRSTVDRVVGTELGCGSQWVDVRVRPTPPASAAGRRRPTAPTARDAGFSLYCADWLPG